VEKVLIENFKEQEAAQDPLHGGEYWTKAIEQL
jgi:hypothetical protein